MKPRSAVKSSTSKCHAETKPGNTDNKGTQDKSKKTAPVKSLTGKVFYLDVPTNKRTEILEHDIKTLGGTVEKFFSKDIRYLVSSKPEARYAHRLANESPVPSPESVLSSPLPPSSKGGQKGSSQGPTDTAQGSRGQSLLKTVVQEQERIQLNKMLSNALEWGVKIVHVEDMLKYIKKKASVISELLKANPPAINKNVKPGSNGRTTFRKHKASRIQKPFVKVEDSSRRFRPLYHHMSQLPVCNFSLPLPTCPFQTEAKKPQAQRPGERPAKIKRKAREAREKKASGYCECCAAKYDRLHLHLKGEKHRAFVAGDHYRELDALIAQLPRPFAGQGPLKQRTKCSVAVSPIQVSIVRDRAEEAAQKHIDGSESLGYWSPGFTASCPSLRKRGRESPSQTNALSLGDIPDFPESSRSKRDPFEWESGPILSDPLEPSATVPPSDKATVDTPDADMDMTSDSPGFDRMKGKRTYKRIRRRKQWKCARRTDPTQTDTLWCSPTSLADAARAGDYRNDNGTPDPVWLVESIRRQTVGPTQQERIQEQVNTTPEKGSQVRLAGETDVNSQQLRLVADTPPELARSRLANVRQEDTKGRNPVNDTTLQSIQVSLTKRRDFVRDKTTDASECMTRQRQVPVVSLPRLDCVDKPPRACTDHQSSPDPPLASPAPGALEDPRASSATPKGGSFSCLQRRRRRRVTSTGQNWRTRGGLVSSQCPPSAQLTVGVESSASLQQATAELWRLFTEEEDLQEDFLGFVD